MHTYVLVVRCHAMAILVSDAGRWAAPAIPCMLPKGRMCQVVSNACMSGGLHVLAFYWRKMFHQEHILKRDWRSLISRLASQLYGSKIQMLFIAFLILRHASHLHAFNVVMLFSALLVSSVRTASVCLCCIGILERDSELNVYVRCKTDQSCNIHLQWQLSRAKGPPEVEGCQQGRLHAHCWACWIGSETFHCT